MMQTNFLQRMQKSTGFAQKSSLLLFIGTACIFSVFCFYRLGSLDYTHWGRQSRPGELFWFGEGYRAMAMKLHLRSVIPAGILMPLQFLPIVRRKYIMLHRYNGRLSLALLLLGNISALIVSPFAFGGTITTQTSVLALATIITFSICKGIQGIRQGKVDVHRVWMLRTWAYAGAILTMRPVNILLHILPIFGPFYTVTTCPQLTALYISKSRSLNSLFEYYPMCEDTAGQEVLVIVKTALTRSRPEQMAALTTMTFGAALWMGTLINVLAVEWYLQKSSGKGGMARKTREEKENRGLGKEE